MENELYYQIALTCIPQIGPVQRRILIEKYETAKAIFQSPTATLEKTEGIGIMRAKSIRHFKDFDQVEKEMEFVSTHGVTPLFINNPNYPKRLLNCYDPPTLLYYKGVADLNHPRIVAIVGTRQPTEYGKKLTEHLIRELSTVGALVISGLAYGIDAIAHQKAIQHNLPTVGVLAHGMHTIYPSQHKSMAREMSKQGGLITEFGYKIDPDRFHFPQRNRIVAGMSDAVIVIETGTKGGSIITANLANGYDREVFAYPGRATDPKSAGCNNLIKDNKAILLTDMQQFLDVMGWDDSARSSAGASVKQQQLFINLTDDEKRVIDLLAKQSPMHFDEMTNLLNLSPSIASLILLELELKNSVQSLPGKLYKII